MMAYSASGVCTVFERFMLLVCCQYLEVLFDFFPFLILISITLGLFRSSG